MQGRDHAQTVAAAERWFVDHGLPWFVDDYRRRVQVGVSRARLVRVAAVLLAVCLLAGLAVGWWAADSQTGVLVGFTAGAVSVAAYSLRSLHGLAVLRWAGRRTLGSLGLLLPLAVRALPMLLLFMTFLFINTEVWQVTSHLEPVVMLASVTLFAAIGTGFLLARLPEELDVFDDELTDQRLTAACVGTPLEGAARELGLNDQDLHRHSDLGRLERANLILVLLVAQAVQVLLLALAVWVFFVVFGAVAIDDAVIESWIGTVPTYDAQPLVSRELIRVSTFLAAFAGLYFTVYAVTDGSYRKQFFTAITRELERAVSVRVVYRSLQE